jgi:hypothetical protein
MEAVAAGSAVSALVLISLLLALLYLVIVAFVLQYVWNHGVVVAIPACKRITFWEALALFIAVRLLFSSATFVQSACVCKGAKRARNHWKHFLDRPLRSSISLAMERMAKKR